MGTIDDILIGNAYASETELQGVSEAFFSQHPKLAINLNEGISEIEKAILLDETHMYKGDHSDYMIRSTNSWIKYKNETIEPNNTHSIKRGNLLICNNRFGQYKGEAQITLHEMENEGDRNKVGWIQNENMFLLDDLKS